MGEEKRRASPIDRGEGSKGIEMEKKETRASLRFRLSFFLPRLPARSQGGGSRACRDVARGRRDGEREAREARRKRRACPAVEKEKNVRWLSSSARRKEEAEGRALSALYLRFYAQPPRQAPRRRCQRGHRGRKRRNERGKEGEKGSGVGLHRRSHPDDGAMECIQSLDASQHSKNRTHSSVDGAGLEGPAPSAIAKR
jgi:hypothetical protein